MSHEALIADLRQKSEARIRKLRTDAEERVAELRRKKETEFERYQSEVVSQQAEEADKVASPILHEAHQSALSLEDEALHRLSKKLYTLAEGLITQARGSDFESTFARLVREVPGIEWETVRVNPADKELAAKYFPQSVIEEDQDIIGGFIAATDGGKYRVVNTLKRRLEKGWPILLPQLLHEMLKERDD